MTAAAATSALAVWVALAAAVGMGAWYRRHTLPSSPPLSMSAPCLLVRPCAGDEPHLQHCLASITASERSISVDVVFAVSHPDDDAKPAIDRAIASLRAAGIRAWTEVHPPQGPNRKASLLAGVEAQHGSTYAVVISADSNVDLSGFPLDDLVTPLAVDARSTVGATWVPHAENIPVPGWGNRASEAVLGGSLHAFSLLCGLDPAGLVGKCFAVRTDALKAAGGWTNLTHYLGEDFELARRLLRCGYRVMPVPQTVVSRAGPRSFREGVDRYARWMTVVRAQRPGLLLTYPLFFFCTPLQLGLCALLLPGGSAPAVLLTGATVAVRVGIALAAQHFSRRPVRPVGAGVDAVLADTMLAVAFLRALATRTVRWRGHILRIDRSGLLRS